MSTKPITKSKIIKQGVVITANMEKTVVVEVERKYRHPIYHKIIKRNKKYKVHDPYGKARVGDEVEIAECRPVSKDKHWILANVLKSVN